MGGGVGGCQDREYAGRHVEPVAAARAGAFSDRSGESDSASNEPAQGAARWHCSGGQWSQSAADGALLIDTGEAGWW